MNRQVRVLWLVKGLGLGGAEQLLVGLAEAMDRDSVELEVGYVLPHKDALAARLRDADVTVHCISTSATVPWPVTLRRLLTRPPFDVVHTHSPVVAAAARMLAPARTRFMHTEHNMWPRYRPATRYANALTLHRNEVVWAVSEGVGESIHPLVPGRELPEVRVLVHGTALKPTVSRAVGRSEALNRLKMTPGPFTIGSVGNLTVKKDQDTLVAAVARLRRTVPDCRLVLIGGGPREDHLQRLVRRLGLEDAVMMLGVRDDVPELLPAFDTFAMSSLFEGLSIALLEAMAMGIPPVVTAVGGMPEVVTHGSDGLLVPAGDPDALSEALATMSADRALRERLGDAARRRAADFDIEPAADALRTAYLRSTPDVVGARSRWVS
jgi:glycosyltransferase involved in cell wall biosynthesis